MLNPRLTAAQTSSLDRSAIVSETLDGRPAIAGVTGLNYSNRSDYINSLVQAIAHVPRLRDALLAVDPDYRTPALLGRLGFLVRRIWSPINWRHHVCPHEFVQAAAERSHGRFAVGRHGCPLAFYVWLANELQAELRTAGAPDFVQRELAGVVRVGDRPTRFLCLQLDPPWVPLSKTESAVNATPQVPIAALLAKFDGRTTEFLPKSGASRTLGLQALPPCLVLGIRRFSSRPFVTEKNKTIVNFPVRDLDLSGLAPCATARYHLRAYICHNGDPERGAYSARFWHQATNTWYDVQDLHFKTILPEEHLLAEALMLFYEQE